MHQPNQIIKSAEDALQMLKDGNARYIANSLDDIPDYEQRRCLLTDNGQSPFSVVVCCSDSRVVPEIYFDMSIGDIFVVRNAGNIIDSTALASIEYAVEHANSKLVVVCGHSHCGAVTAAYNYENDHEQYSTNLELLLDHIRVDDYRSMTIDEMAAQSARNMAEFVRKDAAVKELGIKVVPAYYDIETGVVTWL